jgi:phenylalanyl-tRNA synthetase beta chain
MRTEGSTRWEKGVDPHLAEQAARLASQLLVELAGARWAGESEVGAELPARPVVRLRPERTDRLVGVATPPDEQRAILERIGFAVSGDFTVTVPTWRARDVTREADLVEEVARFRLGDVPPTLPERQAMFGRLTRHQRIRRLVEDTLAGAGFFEAYTYSLVPDGADGIRLEEPLSADHAVLRQDLRFGLEQSARRNLDLGAERIALFELAHVYLPSGGELPDEPWHVAGIVDGGFFAAKGAAELVYDAVGVDAEFARGPGRSATTAEGIVAELDDGLGYFELDLDALVARAPAVRLYEDVLTYPGVKQDLAFVVDEGVSAGELAAAARQAAGPELRELTPFDVYRGEQVGPGRKSIAFAALFQSPERTLSDEDAAALRTRIVTALAERFGAELRA